MRLFLGIKPSKPTLDNIEKWKKSKIQLNVRWTNPDYIHVTIIPPWESDNIPEATSKISQIQKPGPIKITFNKISLGPNGNQIWLTGESSDNIYKYVSDLQSVFSSTNRKFIPHMTLARFKTPQQFETEKINWPVTFHTLYLIKSTLHPILKHEIMQEFPLE